MRVARLCGVLAVLALVAGCSTDSGGDGNLSIVSFSASPETITFGSSVLVSWETTASQRVRLQACSGFNAATPLVWCDGGSVREIAVDNPTARNGSVVVTLQASTQFMLTAFGEGDRVVYSDLAPVMLTTVPPTGPQVVDFRATPRLIFSGDTAHLIVRVLDSPQLEICDTAGDPSRPASWSVLEPRLDPDSDGIVVADREESPTTTKTYALREVDATSALAYTTVKVQTGVSAVPRIVSFTAVPLTVDEGGSVVLSWDTLDATDLRVDPDVTGFDPTSASGTVTFTPAFSGTDRTLEQLYTLTATNGTYSASEQVLITVRGAPQITSFTAVPASVLPSGAVVLTWATTRTDTVTITAVPPDGTLPTTFLTSGTATVNPTASTTYTLTARGITATPATTTADVTVGSAPTVDTFTATPGTVAVGGSAVTLTWTTTNATTVSIVGVPPDATLPGPFAVDGTATAHPTATTTYTITATGAMGGPATRTASVTVVAVGDLVVTEIMFDPAGVADNLGEWFEVLNVSAQAIPLAGLVLSDGTGSHTVSGAGSIAVGDLFVFGINSNATTNGGVTVDYQYTTLSLPNTGALAARVTFDGVLIDGVAYTVPGGWTQGNSMTLNPLSLTAVGNDTAANWCPARVGDTYGTSGNHGTPGAANLCI